LLLNKFIILIEIWHNGNSIQTNRKYNNGLFIITYFENILKELHIHKKLISKMVSYLKKNTQKLLLDFENFKNLVSKFIKS